MKRFSVPFRIDHEVASELLGIDTETILHADPREFPARKTSNKGVRLELYANFIPGIHECVDAFNSSFQNHEIVYFIESQRWPQYFPVSACDGRREPFADQILCNASTKAKMGRPMHVSDIVFTVRNSFDYSEHGLILYGVPYHELDTVKVIGGKIKFNPLEHVLRTIGAPSKAEQYLIDALIKLHWEKWQNKCPNVINGKRRDSADAPRTILLNRSDKYGVEYNDEYGFRGFLEGLHRLVKVINIIENLDHRGIWHKFPKAS